MTEEHQPSAEFVSHLEWQLRTSLARESRFSDPIRSKTGGRMKLTALVLASALLGAGGVVANDEIQDAKVQEVLLARAQADLKLASLEMEVINQQLQETARRFSMGLVGEEALLAARAASLAAEMRLAGLQLDLEEIQLSGKAPNSELSAPRVGGRDFVSSRLALQESVASENYSLAQFRLSRVQQLLEVGAVGAEEHFQVLLALREAEYELERIRERLRVRQSVVGGSMEGSEAERHFGILETEERIELIRLEIQNAMIGMKRTADLVEAGALHEIELQKAQLQVMELGTELEFLEKKLTVLRGGEITP